MSAARRRMEWWIPVVTIVTIVTIVMVLALSVAGLVLYQAFTGPTSLERAAAACSDRTGLPLTAGDEGRSLTVSSSGDLRPKEATGMSACVLDELDAPDSIVSKVEGTTGGHGSSVGLLGRLRVDMDVPPRQRTGDHRRTRLTR